MVGVQFVARSENVEDNRGLVEGERTDFLPLSLPIPIPGAVEDLKAFVLSHRKNKTLPLSRAIIILLLIDCSCKLIFHWICF